MHIRGLLAPHSMRNNVGPARHSIRIQCGTEWMVPFAEPIQCRIKCRIHCIHHFCLCSFPFFTSEWLTFTNSCNIIMFLYFLYASNETKTKQIGQVLMEIYSGPKNHCNVCHFSLVELIAPWKQTLKSVKNFEMYINIPSKYLQIM